MVTAFDKKQFTEFRAFHDSLATASPVDTSETTAAKRKRKAALEAVPEDWFKYYFEGYATAEPADFHKAGTRRVITHPEWYEVRNWSRELAKSTRTMMEVLYLILVGNPIEEATLPKSFTGTPHKKFRGDGKIKYRPKKNVILVSNSKENADRLLLPYMVNLEKNKRIINDYGRQENNGSWAAGEFITNSGAAFRAIGAGQSPRGTRNEASRPDIILIDDIDTDQDCLNPDIMDKRWEWIEQALIPTRSISNPLLIIFCGNIIAEDCCVVRAAERAKHVDVVNIRDAAGKSTWPQKNSEEMIDIALDGISYASQQKEYYNNPMPAGRTFGNIKFDKCPPISTLSFVVAYADPAPSNKDLPGAKTTNGNSRKAVWVVGWKANIYYIYKGYLDVMGTHTFITSLYDCRDYIVNTAKGEPRVSAPPMYFLIENNSLQDPFYDQVYRPIIHTMGLQKGGILSVMPDTRKKPEKWFRIEAALQPLVASSRLVFNINEENDEHMKRLVAQFKAAKAGSKQLDGPDCIEGAIFIINQKIAETNPNAARATARPRSAEKGY